MTFIARATHSVVGYPLSAVWVAGIIALMLLAAEKTSWQQSAAGYTLFVVLVLVFSMLREVKVVHALVNGQREELTDRIDQLINLLHDKDIPVPKEGPHA